MSDIHRHRPETVVFIDPPPRLEGAAGPDCYCGHKCPFPCWQRVGIAPPCTACGCDR